MSSSPGPEDAPPPENHVASPGEDTGRDAPPGPDAPATLSAPDAPPGPAAPSDAGKRRTAALTVVGVVVVLVFAAIVAVGIQRLPAHPDAGPPSTPPTAPPVTAGPQAPIPGVVLPAGATASGITLGRADAPVAIDLYIDFQCPFCQRFEAGSGATLDQMIASGQARVTYHPLSFFDRFSSTRYSSRAAAAAGCAIDAHVYPRFQALLFQEQPPEGGDGLPDQRIIDMGRHAGAGDQFGACVRAQRYAPWISTVTEQATRAGINSTPTLQVNGETIEHTDEDLRDAVRSASG